MCTMEISELYNIAKQYADMIGQEKPEFVSAAESAICVIADSNDQLTTGVSSVTVRGGQVEVIPAETVAVRRFIDNVEGASAKNIVTMMFKEAAVVDTAKASLMILAQADPANGDCMVMTSAEEEKALRDIVPVPEVEEAVEAAAETPEAPAEEAGVEEAANEAVAEVAAAAETSMEDLMNGFDVEVEAPEQEQTQEQIAESYMAEKVGEPAEFADGFSVDESNPFFEEAASGPDSEVKTLDNGVKSMFDQPTDATAKGAAGFSVPPVQGGYPQQGMQGGYPQQGMGYPQQGMQSGYPQQGMGYPQQGRQSGYPQQGMGYPQQGMQSGYPQQGMGYPQQGMQSGYPQQGMGYPQQGRQSGYPQQGMGYPQQGMGYPQQGMQGGYPQQGMGGFPTANPYPQQGAMQSMTMPGVGQTSVHLKTEASPAPTSVSQELKSLHAEDLMKSTSVNTSSLADDDDEDEEDAPMTREEMLKAAKQKKKNAKMNSNFKKKMRDSGF